jgi:hypothetical protein
MAGAFNFYIGLENICWRLLQSLAWSGVGISLVLAKAHGCNTVLYVARGYANRLNDDGARVDLNCNWDSLPS